MNRCKPWLTAVIIAVLAFLVGVVPAKATPLPSDIVMVPSVAETTPSAWSGDSVDDPAIWVNMAQPENSLVIGNNKKGALEVYGLDGTLRQKITTPTGFWGNVDVRGNYVAVAKSGVRVFRVDPGDVAAPLQLASESTGNATTGGEGLCLFDPGTPGVSDGLYVVNIQRKTFRVRVHPLTDLDSDGELTVARHTRQFYLGSEAEGCVVDDTTGQLYVAEEDVGIWRFDLVGSGSLDTNMSGVPARVQVDTLGQHLVADVEGLTLAGTYLIASAQNTGEPWRSWFNVYDLASPDFPRVMSFRVADGTVSDDSDGTDGIAATTANLGPAFPNGLFISQDGTNQAPGAGNQNFKYTPLDAILSNAATNGER